MSLGAGCAHHHPVRGMVLQVNRGDQTVLVSHRDIPHYMRAMVMPFHVRKVTELDGLAPGTEVTFDLVVRGGGSYARRIRRIAGAVAGVVEDQSGRIVLPQVRGKIAVGQAMPDFTLTDQLGRGVRLSHFRGKVVAIDFIYTRCPLPDVCPRLSATFAAMQRRFGARLGSDLVLLSITIDPSYDTSEVLAGYAKIWRAAPDGWRFLTGSEEQIENVAGRFGMIFWAEEGVITHTSQTGVIGRDGRLAALVAGSKFTVRQLGDLIEKQLEEKK